MGRIRLAVESLDGDAVPELTDVLYQTIVSVGLHAQHEENFALEARSAKNVLHFPHELLIQQLGGLQLFHNLRLLSLIDHLEMHIKELLELL